MNSSLRVYKVRSITFFLFPLLTKLILIKGYITSIFEFDLTIVTRKISVFNIERILTRDKLIISLYNLDILSFIRSIYL